MKMEIARFCVRPFRAEDAEALHILLSDPQVMRFIEPPYSPEQTRAFLQSAGLCQPPLVWALIDRQTGALAGQLIFHPYDAARYELGWILSKALWGTGAASELTEAAIAYARNVGIPALILECAKEQQVTRHIAEKFGFCLLEDGALCVFEKRI